MSGPPLWKVAKTYLGRVRLALVCVYKYKRGKKAKCKLKQILYWIELGDAVGAGG